MKRSLWRFLVALGLGMGVLQPSAGPTGAYGQQTGRLASGGSPLNKSMWQIRQASESWEKRLGPEREVVDLVCLVPDMATFLEAINLWDEEHFFPILIDDVELDFKFLRAFRPARVVRFPGRSSAIAGERLWDTAVAAVRGAWTSEPAASGGSAAPSRQATTPPGLVLSAPSSPMLAGAVALAAGRFQPLIRWDVAQHFADVPRNDEARALARSLEERVAGLIKKYDGLGDDCDFLTLAGDWPYKYHTQFGLAAFDDLVGRSVGNPAVRWAFAGRLLGDPAASVYRAMCSLFLQPESALLVNALPKRVYPASDYAMSHAADLVGLRAAAMLREEEGASPSMWSKLFEPMNKFGLILINSSGTSTVFDLSGGAAWTGDIPPSVPTAVLMIHSYAATNPNDPETIAGRWLANGAFIFFGPMNEPYLESFRPPVLVAELIAEGVPLGAAVRRTPPEPYGLPWRHVYLGDPLFRIPRVQTKPRRIEHWGPVDGWPAYRESQQPAAAAPESERLIWVLHESVYRLQRSTAAPRRVDPRADPRAHLVAIRRDQLDVRLRPVYDTLLIDSLLQGNRTDATLLERLAHIPTDAASPIVRRTLEWLRLTKIQHLVDEDDPANAFDFWAELVRSGPTPAYLESLTERVSPAADDPANRVAWRSRLQASQRQLGPESPLAPVISNELLRVERQIAADQAQAK